VGYFSGGNNANQSQYQSNFDQAPANFDDSEGDDDEEDIGSRPDSSRNDLNYDSDEKDEFEGGDSSELISLDGGKKKSVPKLAKPGKD